MNTLVVFTDDFDKVAVYEITLIVFYQHSPSKTFTRDFLIEIQDYCFPFSVTKTSTFEPATLTYTIFITDPLESTFQPFWQTDPTECHLEYRYTVSPEPVNTNLILVNEQEHTVTVRAEELLHETGISSDGVY